LIQALACAKVHHWLISNPISQLGDVEYIHCTLWDFVVLAEEAAAEAQVFALAARACYAVLWRGNVLYIWLVLCLVEDKLIRNAYLHCLDALSCTKLEARNSLDHQEQDVHKILAEKWNDPNLIRFCQPMMSQGLLLSNRLFAQKVLSTK
jgi:hypothetical protein